MGIPIYRLPQLQYGMGAMYRRDWIAPAAPTSLDFVHYGAVVKVYDRSDVKIAEYSSDAQSSRIGKLTFELLPTGPGQLTIELTEPDATIDHAYRIDVHLHGRAQPIYSGFAQQCPGQGSTQWPRQVQAFGWYNWLSKLTYNADVLANSVWRTTDTLARYMENNCRIVYNGAKIVENAQSRWVSDELHFLHCSLLTAVQTLARLAGGFEFGVDAQREFFFRPLTTSVADNSHLWTDKHLDSFAPSTDSTNLVNRYWVRSGKRAATGDNYLPFSVEDVGSQKSYGLREDSFSAPVVFSDADAYRAAAVQLYQVYQPVPTGDGVGIKAPITTDPVDAYGYCQVTDATGASAQYAKAKVRYEIDGNGILCTVTVGVIRPTGLQKLIADMTQRQAIQENIYNLSMQQFIV